MVICFKKNEGLSDLGNAEKEEEIGICSPGYVKCLEVQQFVDLFVSKNHVRLFQFFRWQKKLEVTPIGVIFS